MTKTIQLDIAADVTDQAVRDWAAIHGCSSRLITADGPAGGNPVYEFTGTVDQIENLVNEYQDTGEYQD